MSAQAGRVLIVNADDFGQSAGINRGVIRGHEQGIVTSASLMVRWPAAAEAAAYAQARAELSVGLHLDLAEWEFRGGGWHPLYEHASVADAGAVANELDEQLRLFRMLVGRDPTHLDSHQHAHRDEPVKTIVRRLGGQLGIPVRDFDARVRYLGGFYGQLREGETYPGGVSVIALIELIRALEEGVTELGCHPATDVDFASMYRIERLRELESLCDPRVRTCVNECEVSLVSFAGIG
jgi:predicted glycoside hydrolase/deacetylase ChbG (UPF0249 family)